MIDFADFQVNKSLANTPSAIPSTSLAPAALKLRGRQITEQRPPYKKDNFYKKRYTQLDDMAAAVGSTTLGWTKFTGTCVLANSKEHVFSPLGCSNAMKLTSLSSFERVQKNIPGIVPSAGTLMVPVYITEMPVDYSPVPPTLPTYQTASIQVILSVDSGFATTIATSLNLTSAQFLRAGWNCLQWDTNDDGTLNTTGNPAWVYGGTAPGTKDTVYNYMRIVLGGFQPLNTTTPVVHIGGVFQGGKATPQVMINVDDGHVDTMAIAAAAQRFGLRIASSVITGTVGQGAQMSWAQHKNMSDAGHDIIAHSRTHPIAGFDSLTTTQLASELLCGQDLIANGLGRVADVIAFPENATNDVVNAATKAAGFTLARASKPGWTHTATGLDNGMMVGSRDVGGKTLAQVKKYLDSAQTYNCLQIIYVHRIYTTAIQSMTYSNGVVTVNANGHGYSNGHTAIQAGADQAEYNVAGLVENATTNSYTFKVTGTFSAATATSANANLRTYSPNFPANTGTTGTPPANTLYWYWSDYLALLQEIADRRDAGTITPVVYSNILDRCNINS